MGSLSNNKKNLVLIPIIILAIAFVLFQLYSLFIEKSNMIAKTGGQVSKVVAIPKLKPMPKNIAPIKSTKTILKIKSTTPSESQLQQKATPKVKNNQATAEFNRSQHLYLKMLNKYQLLKMKRQLFDEELAIINAKQKISKINTQMGTASSDDIGDINDVSLLGDNKSVAPTTSTEYRLVYIDKQNGTWTATLNQHGTFFEIIAGSKLENGAKVLDIDANGVTLKNNQKLTRLTFSGSQEIHKKSQVLPAQKIKADKPQPVKKNLKTIPHHLHKITFPPRQRAKLKVKNKPRKIIPLKKIKPIKTQPIKAKPKVAPKVLMHTKKTKIKKVKLNPVAIKKPKTKHVIKVKQNSKKAFKAPLETAKIKSETPHTSQIKVYTIRKAPAPIIKSNPIIKHKAKMVSSEKRMHFTPRVRTTQPKYVVKYREMPVVAAEQTTTTNHQPQEKSQQIQPQQSQPQQAQEETNGTSSLQLTPKEEKMYDELQENVNED